MSDPRVVDPGHAPTPFTADEIRRGCPVGRQVTVVHTSSTGAHEYWTTTFAKTDATNALIINQQVAESGSPLGGASELWATWDELQAHASFPVEHTVITEETITTPIGEMECLLYTVTEGAAVKTLWFARSLAGLPIKTVYMDDDVPKLSTLVVRDTQADPPTYSV